MPEAIESRFLLEADDARPRSRRGAGTEPPLSHCRARDVVAKKAQRPSGQARTPRAFAFAITPPRRTRPPACGSSRSRASRGLLPSDSARPAWGWAYPERAEGFQMFVL